MGLENVQIEDFNRVRLTGCQVNLSQSIADIEDAIKEELIYGVFQDELEDCINDVYQFQKEREL